MFTHWNGMHGRRRRFYPYSMRHGTRVGGMVIAFQCILVVSFLGFGLTLMGTIMTATSYNDPFQDDPFFSKHQNPIKIIGPIFLGVGLMFIVFSIILCILSVKTGRKLFHQEQQQSAQPGQTNVTTYPSTTPQGNYPLYPPQQPAPQGNYQPYPQQPSPSLQKNYPTYPQQPPPSPQGGYQPYPQQPVQPNISPSQPSQGGYPPYPPQSGYQYVPTKDPADVPPPYPSSEATAPYNAPSYPTQPAYNPSAS